MHAFLPNALLILTLIALGGSLAFSIRDLRRSESTGAGIALSANLAGLALLLSEFVYVSFLRGGVALSALGDSVVFFALAVLTVNTIAVQAARNQVVSLFLTPVAMILTLMSLFFERWFPTGEAQRAVGQSFLVAHIILFVMSYAMFASAAAFGAMFLALDGSLKSKTFSTVFFKLPGLARLDAFAARSALCGLALLSLAIALSVGSLVQSSTALAPGGEPVRVASDFTILASYATWLYYAAFAVCRLALGWIGRRSSMMAIVGLVLVLGFYVGGLLAPGGSLHAPGTPAVAKAREGAAQ